MTLSVVQKTIRAIVATGILFLVAILAMGLLSYRLSDLDYWTIHTHKVIEELKDSLSSLQDVETGDRGYLLTHRQEFLDVYKSGKVFTFTHIDEIKRLTMDNAIQQQNVVALAAIARKRIEKATELLAKFQQSADTSGLVIGMGEGKKLMDAFREQIKVMTSTEDKLLQKRMADLRFTQYATWTTTAGLAALAMMLLNWVFQITRTAIQDEKRIAEDQTRKQEHTFRLLVSGVKDYAIFMLDPGGHVMTWNEGAELNKGYKAEEIIGRHFSCFYVDEDIQLGTPATELLEAIASGRCEVEGLRKRKDGSTFWANVVISAIKDEQGELIGFAKVSRDLTERRLADDARTAISAEKLRVSVLNAEIEQQKRIEKALKEVTINLARSNADLQQFAYVASHDLQEPLRAVTGFLTLLASKQAGNLDADSQKYINHAVEGAHRMRALVNDLLAYARVESRGKELEPVQLSKVLDRVKLDLSAAIDESAAVIISDELPTVMGDTTQLAQLFQNLIGNAIKFRSSMAPEVRIKCNPQNSDWLFSFQDNGRGFDMEHAERIFVIFQRLQGREQASGTGIGLALCKKIVERHNGKIWVESKPDQGSTFFFTLPQSIGDAKDNDNH
jgi:PAS domain S-box-containing protein